MKKGAKKIIAVGLGVCVLALGNVFLVFATKPYTEKVIIWLPDNYRLENIISNEVVSIMPNLDVSRQSNIAVFYSVVVLDSFKELARKNEKVLVSIEDASRFDDDYYRIVYQKEFDCENKSFVVTAQVDYRYNRATLSEMGLRGGALFLKNKRNTDSMYQFSIAVFLVIATAVSFYLISLSVRTLSKQSNN